MRWFEHFEIRKSPAQSQRFPKRFLLGPARSEAAAPGPAPLGRRVGTTAGAVCVALAVAGRVSGDGGTPPDSGDVLGSLGADDQILVRIGIIGWVSVLMG